MIDNLKEALRPFKDFLFYAPRCLKVLTKDAKIEPLKLNRAQTWIHAKLEEQKAKTGKIRALIVKGRQQGASTYIEGRFYHRTSTDVGLSAVILTHAQDSTDKLFNMAKRYHDNCPEVIKPVTSSSSAKELHFSDLDSGYSVATAGSKATGRGWTAQLFHGSEMAFWPNAEDHLAGIGQAVPDMPGTEIILESTGNGVGNAFYRMCMNALRGVGEYILIFVPWFWQEEYTKQVPPGFELTPEESEYKEKYGLTDGQMFWRRVKIADDFQGDEALFDQEYPATIQHAFRRVAGNPLIPADHVERARKALNVEPTGAKVMGVDVAEYGDDDTVFILRQGRKAWKCVRHHGKGPMEVAGLVALYADIEKPEAIMVDCTGVGSGVADRLIELGYPVHRIHFGSKALENQIYGIRRDEMWGDMRNWFAEGGNSIPDDDALEVDLTAPQYGYDSSRRLKLESKESMKNRSVNSPDAGDALALTFAYKFAVQEPEKASPRKYNWRVGA